MQANGVALHGIAPTNVRYTWNDLFAVLTDEMATQCSSACNESYWQYDGAGRMTTEQAPYVIGHSQQNETVTRVYDAENHLYETELNFIGNPEQIVLWGPDGHPIVIGSLTSLTTEKDERLHWNGDQLLFTTHTNSTGQDTLDDIKVDVQGDILPGDQGYSGLTFYDRAPGGTVMGCHNTNGTNYAGLGDSWLTTYSLSPCLTAPTGKMPKSVEWSGSPFQTDYGATIGQGGTLGMPRTDGFTDGFDTIQGVRAYNNGNGTWTTPDTYGGVVEDPASQKKYLWNGNNPINNMDPSGYVSVLPQPPGATPQLPDTWDPVSYPVGPTPTGVCGGGPCLKTIVVVTAHRPPPRPVPSRMAVPLIRRVGRLCWACLLGFFLTVQAKSQQRVDSLE